MLRFKDETELEKFGVRVDPTDPSKAVPIPKPGDGRRGTAAAEAKAGGGNDHTGPQKVRIEPFGARRWQRTGWRCSVTG